MITVAEAARRVGRDPETIRRWIRSGKLPSRRLGLQHLIDERDLDEVVAIRESLPLPTALRRTFTGGPQPDWARIVRRSRHAH